MAVSVSHADWSLCWDLPMSGSLAGGGLRIMCADYKGRGGLLDATQPFVLVPYHKSSGPFFKDGLNPQGGGVVYTPIRWDSPNRGWVSGETDIFKVVNVETLPATEVEPASIVISAKYQVGNYQYVHRWTFAADGSIEATAALAGQLLPTERPTSHVHNFYFRFHIALGAPDLVAERQTHSGNTDSWNAISNESRWSYGRNYTRFRLRHKTIKNVNGQPRSWEFEGAPLDGPDGTYSTGDVWFLRDDGFGSQMGAEVGQKDTHLHNGYGSGASLAGHQIIIWHVVREHHRTAHLGEESITVPYHFNHLRIRPRDLLDGTPTALYATNPISP